MPFATFPPLPPPNAQNASENILSKVDSCISFFFSLLPLKFPPPHHHIFPCPPCTPALGRLTIHTCIYFHTHTPKISRDKTTSLYDFPFSFSFAFLSCPHRQIASYPYFFTLGCDLRCIYPPHPSVLASGTWAHRPPPHPSFPLPPTLPDTAHFHLTLSHVIFFSFLS